MFFLVFNIKRSTAAYIRIDKLCGTGFQRGLLIPVEKYANPLFILGGLIYISCAEQRPAGISLVEGADSCHTRSRINSSLAAVLGENPAAVNRSENSA